MDRHVVFTRRATIGACGVIGLCVLGIAPRAEAGFFTFDPDGALPGNAPSVVGGLDWSVGNSLAINSIPPVAGNTFQQLQQASLSAVINTNGQPVTPAGLNSTFEITLVTSSTQVYTSVSANAQFTHNLAAVQATNSFFEIWFDPTRDANPLAGTGFNDGTRILLGSPSPATPSAGAYDYAQGATGGFITEPLDQFGANDYPTKVTAVGAGGMSYDGTVTSGDSAYFIDALLSLAFNTSLVTAFEETNPSALFAALAGGAAPAVVPNNVFNGVQSPDFQFQADANNTFTVVPEPAGALSMALTAIGAGSLRTRRRYR